MGQAKVPPYAVDSPFFTTQGNIMFNQAFSKSFTLVRQCLVPMLLLSAAAHVSAAGPTDTVSFALCRGDAGATQFAKNKDGTWNALSSTGAGAKLTFYRSDENLFSLINASGKYVEIDLHQRTCQVILQTGQSLFYTLEVSAAL